MFEISAAKRVHSVFVQSRLVTIVWAHKRVKTAILYISAVKSKTERFFHREARVFHFSSWCDPFTRNVVMLVSVTRGSLTLGSSRAMTWNHAQNPTLGVVQKRTSQ